MITLGPVSGKSSRSLEIIFWMKSPTMKIKDRMSSEIPLRIQRMTARASLRLLVSLNLWIMGIGLCLEGSAPGSWDWLICLTLCLWRLLVICMWAQLWRWWISLAIWWSSMTLIAERIDIWRDSILNHYFWWMWELMLMLLHHSIEPLN